MRMVLKNLSEISRSKSVIRL
jgi:hypothetical protein